MRAILILLAMVLSACGGGDPERERLDRTFDFTASMLRDVARKEAAMIAWQGTLEMGGTPVDYVITGAPEHADFSKLRWKGAPEPWSVRIDEGDGPDQLLLQAFAADTGTPARSETVSLARRP